MEDKTENLDSIYCSDSINNIIRGIDIVKLKQYYIDENHSQEECAKYFNCSRSTIMRVCRDANLKKDKSSIDKKRKQTTKEKYGVENVFNSDEMQQHMRDIIKTKYGVDNISQLDEIKKQKEKTCLSNYGVKNPMQKKEIQEIVQEKSKITCQDRYGVPYYILTDDAQEKLKDSSSSRVHSKPNEDFAKFLMDNNISFTREEKIEKYGYDFKIGDKLIEINPAATHNIEWSPFGDHSSRIDKNYHKLKSEIARKNNYSCMMIWDWDNKNAIYNYFIGKRETIYARVCEIKLINESESKKFIENYHFQGYAKANITYGLYYNNELISIMSFDKPRYNKNYQWEIIRYCSSKNVIGGAEKLFNHFIKDYNPSSIVSYCDLSKFSGRTYKKLGFVPIRVNVPSLHWYNLKDKRHFTDNLIRSRGVSRIVNHCEPSEDIIAIKANTNDNYKLMLLNGFLPIYDCGQQTWGWKK